jgi:hypothetical protein
MKSIVTGRFIARLRSPRKILVRRIAPADLGGELGDAPFDVGGGDEGGRLKVGHRRWLRGTEAAA